MKRADNVISVGILVVGIYLALVPSISLVPFLEPYNEKRVLQIGLLLLGGALLLASGPMRRRWIEEFNRLPLLARWGLGTGVGLGVLSAALAPAPSYAFLELGHVVLLVVLGGIVAAAARHNPKWCNRLIVGAIGLSAALYAIYFLVLYGATLALPDLEVGRETIGGFANTRHFNQYQTWTLPLLGTATLFIPGRWRVGRVGVFFLLSLWWMLVLVSNVRGTVVAMVIAAVGVGLLFRRRAARWLGVQFASVLVGALLYYLLFDLVAGTTPQVANRLGEVGGDAWRIQRWKTSLELAWAHPWLGVGPMHFAWPLYHFVPGAHPHNALLQWMAEWGLPSAAIMSGLVIWGGWSWMRQEQRDASGATPRENAVRVGLVAAVLAGAAHAMVSGIIVMPVSQVLLVLVGGWAWGRYRHTRTPSSEPSRLAHALFCVLLVGSIAVVGSSVRDLAHAEERQSAYLEAVEEPTFWPRYWQQGYIGVRDSSVMEQTQPE